MRQWMVVFGCVSMVGCAQGNPLKPSPAIDPIGVIESVRVIEAAPLVVRPVEIASVRTEMEGISEAVVGLSPVAVIVATDGPVLMPIVAPVVERVEGPSMVMTVTPVAPVTPVDPVRGCATVSCSPGAIPYPPGTTPTTAPNPHPMPPSTGTGCGTPNCLPPNPPNYTETPNGMPISPPVYGGHP